MPSNKLAAANICFNLKQASFALIFLFAPGTALHAVIIAPGGDDDSQPEQCVSEIRDQSRDVSEPVHFCGNGVDIDKSESLQARVTANECHDSRSMDISSQEAESSQPAPEALGSFEYPAEPFNTGWAIVLDNDAWVSSSRDEDYTGGVSVGLGGNRVTKYRFSLNPALTWVNKKLHLDGGRQPATLDHMMRFGLALFTPDLGSTGGPKAGDRPFANLLFLENSQIRVDANRNRAYQTTLTLGILGSDVGEAVQDAIHDVGDNNKVTASGYQISDGGELTARYAVSMQSLLQSRLAGRDKRLELKYRVEGTIGYITEGSVTLAARWGQAGSPWWSFAPSRSNYLPQPVSYSRHQNRAFGRRDFFLWSAITVRARAYNALLQGQFRDSEITYSGGELNHILGELSVGFTRKFSDAINVSFALHYQTNEIKHDTAAKNIRWGGLTIQKSF